MRQWCKEGLGFNCTFVDDDMKVIVGLAQRAVLAGLATDFDADMQKRFSGAFLADAVEVIVGLAQRAVLAGLATDFDADMQKRVSEGAEKHRADHGEALGRAIVPASTV